MKEPRTGRHLVPELLSHHLDQLERAGGKLLSRFRLVANNVDWHANVRPSRCAGAVDLKCPVDERFEQGGMIEYRERHAYPAVIACELSRLLTSEGSPFCREEGIVERCELRGLLAADKRAW